ncbi:hypothetical protein J437_LFUL008724 [Ladona fulva]|uniref:Uncharacterized protein n=1 Tax=Ladona fulva TaxID=123851 RepID=A0A8K0K6I2_LADFU|nr:hypothetical protein J437_LFUL008724 [Ladona fulva]
MEKQEFSTNGPQRQKKVSNFLQPSDKRFFGAEEWMELFRQIRFLWRAIHSVKASTKICEACKARFGISVSDQDKLWALHFSTAHQECKIDNHRYRGENRVMKFAIKTISQEPTDHSSDRYFYMMDPSNSRAGNNAFTITFPDLNSSIVPVPYCQEFSVFASLERKPILPQPKDLNNLIRGIDLTKSNADLLTSQLKQWNLLDEIMNFTVQRKLHNNFFQLLHQLKWTMSLAQRGQPESLVTRLNLFIDRSSRSQKEVLLHNGNKYPSLPPGSLSVPQIGLQQLKDFAGCLEV